jgi:hypothetical protein
MQTDFLGFLNAFDKAIDIGKDKLKEVLIHLFTEKGDFETVEKIKEKGLPDALHVYGEKTTCLKTPFIFIQKSPIVPKDTILAVWNKPKYPMGGIVYGTSNQLIHGGEIVVPFTGFKGATPYDNEPYLFQFND